ncbi:MAG: D-alanyl-D-alanine carboxypeptidase [Pseudomonadota bacterium]
MQASFALLVAFGVLFGSFGGPSQANANPRYAALVVDARNGEVLFSRHANAPRFPASLTKVMTLYILFEELEAGRLSLDTRMNVSAHAQAQPPSELGLRSGQTITVRDAMMSLVTKSANDAAAVIAEHIGGTEWGFAQRMTETARRIGMSDTTFRNASGLPNREQRTTAHDMVLMGRAIYERFPQRYQIFSTTSFRYAGRTYRNHNRLLGSVRGVDGIKTGYIRASGFNLLSSVNDGGRHIVAVVMGGRTGASRNAHMRDLIARHLPQASTGPRTASLVVARAQYAPPSPVPHPAALPAVAFAAANAMMASAPPQPLPAPLAAVEVATVSAPASASMVATHSPAAPAATASASGGMQLGSVPADGWTIQIGAMPSQEAAVDMLAQARGSVSDLTARTPYTQSVQSNGNTLWRARFGGFNSRDVAQAACSALEARSFACLAVRPDR